MRIRKTKLKGTYSIQISIEDMTPHETAARIKAARSEPHRGIGQSTAQPGRTPAASSAVVCT